MKRDHNTAMTFTTGKMNRGLMVVVSLCHLVGDRPLTAEEERLAFTMGWCVEMVRLYNFK